MAGDGQVTIGQTIVKAGARKVRKLYHDRVLAGFAGAAADAFTLFARFEAKLEEHRGNLPARRRRAGQGLAHRPRAAAARGAAGGGRRGATLHRVGHRRRDRARRRPDRHRLRRARTRWPRPARCAPTPTLDAKAIAEEAIRIAAGICVYTNDQITVRACDRPPTRSMTGLTPAQIVAELDRYIVGQDKAKRAVAIALRNRWRRQNLPAELRDEVAPKNIIMIGPTGVGKTEIARRLAKLAQAPFLKVEASKYTEVGYVGRDVESMIRDLTELGVTMVKAEMAAAVREQAEALAEERLLDLLLPRRPGEPFVQRHARGGVARRLPRRHPGEAPRPAAAGQLDDRSIEMDAAAGQADARGPAPARAWRRWAST